MDELVPPMNRVLINGPPSWSNNCKWSLTGRLVHRSTSPSLSPHNFLIRKWVTKAGITKLPGFERTGPGFEFGQGLPDPYPVCQSTCLLPVVDIWWPPIFRTVPNILEPITFVLNFTPKCHLTTKVFGQREQRTVWMDREFEHTKKEGHRIEWVIGTKHGIGTKDRIQYIYCLLYHRIPSLLDIQINSYLFIQLIENRVASPEVLPTLISDHRSGDSPIFEER